MRGIVTVWWTLFWLAVAGAVAWLLGLDDMVRASLSAGRLLDWVMGVLCLLWLLAILKWPWDLYFQAQAVAFEQQRSRERGIAIVPGREAYIRTLRRRLGWLAVGAHLFSAAFVAGVASFTGGEVGYYFAAFYLVSTAFRPAVAGYVYLSRKLQAIGKEARYPREDVVDLQAKVKAQEENARTFTRELKELREELRRETQTRDAETRALRQSVHAVSREFETTVSRLTDNQEVIRGIQAFVRLVSQSAARDH
jgi:hypothetical protein